MLKSSCCNHSYTGIKEDLFKQALAERAITNGVLIPCLSCRTLYSVENYALREVRKLSMEETVFLLKESAEQLLERIMPKPKQKTQEEELEAIYSEFKDLPLD